MATTETGPDLRAKIEAARKDELGKLYEELVGHDPFGEPVPTPGQHAELVRDMLLHFCTEAGLL